MQSIITIALTISQNFTTHTHIFMNSGQYYFIIKFHFLNRTSESEREQKWGIAE